MNEHGQESHIRGQAKAAIRRRLHAKLFNAMNDLPDELPLSDQVALVEDVVIEALGDPTIGWAMAYLAGVVMAPELIRDAQLRPAQPPPESSGKRGSVLDDVSHV